MSKRRQPDQKRCSSIVLSSSLWSSWVSTLNEYSRFRMIRSAEHNLFDRHLSMPRKLSSNTEWEHLSIFHLSSQTCRTFYIWKFGNRKNCLKKNRLGGPAS